MAQKKKKNLRAVASDNRRTQLSRSQGSCRYLFFFFSDDVTILMCRGSGCRPARATRPKPREQKKRSQTPDGPSLFCPMLSVCLASPTKKLKKNRKKHCTGEKERENLVCFYKRSSVIGPVVAWRAMAHFFVCVPRRNPKKKSHETPTRLQFGLDTKTRTPGQRASATKHIGGSPFFWSLFSAGSQRSGKRRRGAHER